MRPLCAACGEPIGVFERLWLEPAGGGLISSSLMKLRDEERRKARRMYHAGCISTVTWQACGPVPSLAGPQELPFRPNAE